MSNNIGHHSEFTDQTEVARRGGLPIFAAKYQDHAIAVLKNSDFSATILSIRNAFRVLDTIPTSQIRLSSRFDAFGDLLVELTRDVWKEVLPELKVVEVSTDTRTHGETRNEIGTETLGDEAMDSTISDKVSIHVVGGPTDLALSVPETSTALELKEMVFQLEPRLAKKLIFSHQEIDLADDSKQLREYGITNHSIVSIATNIQVYVTTPERTKVPMRITLYARVSSLKLLIDSRLEIPVHIQIPVCAGEELDDARQLGSYHQIFHNCQILVDKLSPELINREQVPLSYRIEVKPVWAATDDDDDEEGDSYFVFSDSTVLDLKVLIYNLNMISPSRQCLEFRGRLLEDELTMGHYQVGRGDVLIMRINNQNS